MCRFIDYRPYSFRLATVLESRRRSERAGSSILDRVDLTSDSESSSLPLSRHLTALHFYDTRDRLECFERVASAVESTADGTGRDHVDSQMLGSTADDARGTLHIARLAGLPQIHLGSIFLGATYAKTSSSLALRSSSGPSAPSDVGIATTSRSQEVSVKIPSSSSWRP